MDDDIKRIIEEDELRDAERILEEMNSDPILRDVEAPEVIRDKLFAQIQAHEEQKAFEQLSNENRELIRLGKVYKRRRKLNRYLVVFAALVAVFVVGTVSMGEGENVFNIITEMFAGRKQTVVNSENTEPIQYFEEDEIYEKIEDAYSFIPVRFGYLPETTVFQEAVFGAEIQSINIIYGTDDKASIIYIIRPNYRASSFGTDIEDEKLQEYQMIVNNVEITITEYHIAESGENSWSVCFVYQDTQYLLTITDMEQEEVEKIVKGLTIL